MNNRHGGPTTVPVYTRHLRSRLRCLWSAYWQLKAHRAAVVVLPMLDDRILEDIGLTRSDVRAIVLAGRTDRVQLNETCRADGARTYATKPQSAAVGMRSFGLTPP